MTSYLWTPPPVPWLPVRGKAHRLPVNRLFFVGRNDPAHAVEMGRPVDKSVEGPCAQRVKLMRVGGAGHARATGHGLVTPPVGPGLYIAMVQADIRRGPLFRATILFLAMVMRALVPIAAVPALSTWLPAVTARG